MAKVVNMVEQPRLREIVHNGVTVGVQLDFNIIIRIYMTTTTPQRFGVKILRELSEILSREDVKAALGIPDFDRALVRESTHSPLEADLTLLKEGEIVGRYSVKASPTGNLDYIVKSWRSERMSNDLIAIIPLEGRKDNETIYYVALILIPRMLKSEHPSRIKKYLRSVLDAKREGEKLDRLWPTDFIELSNALRDHQILQIRDELATKQDEMLEMQKMMLRKQDEMLEMQKMMLSKFDIMINILKKIYQELKRSKK